ncbi:nucleoside 2-deoxyribosyltransferase domain-containing protein [Candidatus Pacearchaeota archaeon]|nr:nucleoside 2-deoxyribosyltransferase domain-containing protein [Candidatus Pacearchaeota archaeon]
MRKGEILVAPTDNPNIGDPLVFLAGPIQGTPDWQEDAIKYLHSHAPELNIASPRRRGIQTYGTDFTEAMYNEQVDWESKYLSRSAFSGAILFWLAKEQEHFPNRAYAQTTRFELAEWMQKKVHMKLACDTKVRMVVGIENGFTGARYIRRRFSQDASDIPIYSTLEETCDRVILEAIHKGFQPPKHFSKRI